MRWPARPLLVLLLAAFTPAWHGGDACAATDEPAGRVESLEIDQTGTCSAWLSNGLRVNHRRMEAGSGRVLVAVTLAGGELEETGANRGITQLSIGALTDPTDNDAAEMIASGALSAQGETDRVRITLEISEDLLADALGGLRTLLSAPVLTESALESRRSALLEAISAAESAPAWTESKALVRAVFPEDPRVVHATPMQLASIERLNAQRWIDRLCAGPMEIAIVGDVALDRAITEATQTLGTLPNRPRIRPGLFDRLRTLERPNPARAPAPAQQAPIDDGRTLLIRGFYGADVQDVDAYRTLWVVSQVLQRRLESRITEAGIDAELGSSAIAGAVFPEFGLMVVRAWVAPDQADALDDILREAFVSVRTTNPVRGDEIAPAATALADEADRIGQDVMYWSQFLSQMTYRGIDPVMLTVGRETYESMTPGQVRRVLERYAGDDDLFQVRLDATDQ